MNFCTRWFGVSTTYSTPWLSKAMPWGVLNCPGASLAWAVVPKPVK